MTRNEPVIPFEVQAAIAQVVKNGETAKVSLDRKGEWHIQRERVCKVNITQPKKPQP